MSLFTIKQNDTAPVLRATLYDADGVVVDLTSASVRFHMREKGGDGTAIVDAAATLEDATGGIVKYTWDAADTDVTGTYEAEFEVTYASGAIETFPNRGYITVRIYDDIV